MNTNWCEAVRLSAMAQADGELPELTVEQMETHLAQCSECRREVAELRVMVQLLDAQHRQPVAADLWPDVSRRLRANPSGLSRLGTLVRWMERAKWPAFGLRCPGSLALLAEITLLLLTSQFIILSSTRATGVAVRLAVVVLLGFLFLWRRENPFNINPELAAPAQEINL